MIRNDLKFGLLLLFLALSGAAPAEERPIVVELFTAEGCSACPPADRLLGELAQRPDILALAFHVDYWDHLGWKDPFSFHDATLRQRRYAGRLNLSNVYTPQMVVEGATDAVGSDRAEVGAALGSPRQGPPIRLRAADGKLQIGLAAQAGAPSADVFLVAYRSAAETKVLRGENAGRMLKEYAIVRALRLVGRWKGKAADFSVDLSSLPADADMAAVLIQSADQGPMIGAANVTLR